MSLKTVNVRIYFHLPPCFIGDFHRGINEQLNSYLMRYIPELKGVPLSYSDVKIQEKVANVLYDSPNLHLHATVKFTLFAPREGTEIVGIVNKVSSDHIGLLVHGVFNASIAADQIRKKEFHFNHGAKAWRRVDEDGEAIPGQAIGAGSVVKFTIVGLPTNNNMLTLSGSLTKHPYTTGLVVLDPSAPPHPTPVLIHDTTSTTPSKSDSKKPAAVKAEPENSKIYFDMEAEVNDAHAEDNDEWVVKAGGDGALEGLEGSKSTGKAVEVKTEGDVKVKKEKKDKKEKKEESGEVKGKKRKSDAAEDGIVKVKKEKKAKV